MNNKARLWSVDDNATILKDRSFDFYKTVRKEAKVQVKAVKNEYEGAQLIISAAQDTDYDIRLSDLTDEKGNLLAKENIQIFHCKYTYVEYNIEAFRGYGVGHYPNALLPFHATKSYGENKVAAGENQTVYFVFYIPTTQAAGVYTGSFIVTVDGEEREIPVSVDIWDITLSDENHLRTLFLTDWHWDICDKARKFETYDSFTKVLTEYRLSPYTLIPYTQDKSDLPRLYEFHAQLAYEYCLNPRNSTFAMPYTSWERKREDRGGIKGTQSETEKGLDCDVFENFLVALIHKSLEKNFNIYRKATAHFGRFIDEPNGQGTMDRLITTYNQYHEILNRLSADLLGRKAALVKEYGVTEAFVEELAACVKEMPHIITGHYDEKYDAYIDYYCPCFWVYQNKAEWAHYENRTPQKWWYGCNGPYSPCPTYHLDDTLLSPRILSWMQADFGYEGNLFWGVNYYSDSKTKDYYGYNISDGYRPAAANGDALLMFPAEPYGLEKPTVSLRIEKIRDGMEEYELLRDLKLAYAACGADYTDVLHHMTRDMYEDIRIYSSNESFAYARNLLLSLLLAVQSPAKLCISALKRENGVTVGQVRLAKGYTLLVNGAPVVGEKMENGATVYALNVKERMCVLSVPEWEDGKAISIVYRTERKFFAPDEKLNEAFSSYNNTAFAYVLQEKSEVYPNAPMGVCAQFHLKSALCHTHYLKYTGEALKAVGKNTDRIHFYFHNDRPHTKYERLTIYVKYAGAAEAQLAVSHESYLAPGDTLVTIPELYTKDWDTLREIEYIDIAFGEENEEQAGTRAERTDTDYIYFGGVEVVFVKE